MISVKVTEKEEAEKDGFVPITEHYRGYELEMLEDAILQLGDLEYRVIKDRRGMVLCRKSSEVVVV